MVGKPLIQENLGRHFVSTVQLPDGRYETIAVRPRGKKDYDWGKPVFQSWAKSEAEALEMHTRARKQVLATSAA